MADIKIEKELTATEQETESQDVDQTESPIAEVMPDYPPPPPKQ